jgi:hypothetical protein
MTALEESWPVLDWPQWQSCGDRLHMLTQIVGKTRLALTPKQNHWWNVPLYVTARRDGPRCDAAELLAGNLRGVRRRGGLGPG